MAYRLKRNDRSLEAAVRRIAREQIDAALGEIDDPALGLSDKVHQVRQRCKQLRGLIGLVRPAFAGYAEANARLRMFAAPLSAVRDADVMIATCDHLVETAELDQKAVAPVRLRLVRNRRALAGTADVDALLASSRKDLSAFRNDVAGWSLDADGFDAVAGGVSKTYRQARTAMARARKHRAEEDFHDWRKRVKYHWYHTRLLSRAWPAEMMVHAEAAKALGELLGEYHDMTVLSHMIAIQPADYGVGEAVAGFLAKLDRQIAVAGRRALADGQLLLAEKPGALVDRWRAYWDAWQQGGAS